MPFALASWANSLFQVSKPAAELPHWAASARAFRQASMCDGCKGEAEKIHGKSHSLNESYGAHV